MPSWQSEIVQLYARFRIKHHVKPSEAEIVKFARARFCNPVLARWFTPKDVRIQPIDEKGVRGEWVWWEKSENQPVIYHLHGGAYITCSPSMYRPFTAEIAQQSGARVFSLDYRLAPEHRFPAAIDDALAGYRWLLAQGIPANKIVVSGDSAGGGLTMALLISLRDAGEPLPGMAFCFSPWVDLTGSGESYETNDQFDPMFYRDTTPLLAPVYLGATPPTHPLASPIFADLTGLPPLHIYVGSTEILLDDAKKLVARAQSCGVSATLQIADRQPHVWPIMVGLLPEAKETIREVADIIHEALSLGPSRTSASHTGTMTPTMS